MNQLKCLKIQLHLLDSSVVILKNLKILRILNKKELALINYTKNLTFNASAITEDDILNLRHLGISDGEILEVNQVVAYFNYVNRTVLGLGVNTDNEILGLSPKNKDDESAWNHK